MYSNDRVNRVVRTQVYSGSISTPTGFLGIDAWYVPWDSAVTARMLDPSLYSTNRYCTINGYNSGNTQWSGINTAPGTYVWTDMDLWVNYHYARGTDLEFNVSTQCPYWASSRQSERVGIYGCPNEPSNMSYFVDWLNAVGSRYNNKIKYWSIANEPGFEAELNPGVHTSEFTGTRAKYAEMCRVASQVLKNINPANKICGPEPSQITPGNTTTKVIGVLNASAVGYDVGLGDGPGTGTTGKDWIDIITVHSYASALSGGNDKPTDPYLNWPVNWPDLFNQLSAAGVGSKDVWVSEIMMIPNANDNLYPEKQYAFLIRGAVLAMISGIKRYLWFGYGGSSYPWYKPAPISTQANQFWQQMINILYGSPITSVNIMTDDSMEITRADGKIYYV